MCNPWAGGVKHLASTGFLWRRFGRDYSESPGWGKVSRRRRSCRMGRAKKSVFRRFFWRNPSFHPVARPVMGFEKKRVKNALFILYPSYDRFDFFFVTLAFVFGFAAGLAFAARLTFAFLAFVFLVFAFTSVFGFFSGFAKIAFQLSL